MIAPGNAGLPTNSCVRLKPDMRSVSDAVAEVTDIPEVVALTAELSMVMMLGIASLGICKATEKVQVLSGISEPPVRVKVSVPLKVEPLPQTSVCEAVLVVIPDKALSKSTVKVTFVALAVLFSL